MKAKMTYAKAAKMLRLEIPVGECDRKVANLVNLLITRSEIDWLNNQARDVAAVMEGRKDWQGIQSDWKSYSGMEKQINAHMKTHFKVTEKAMGDGYSMYYLK